MMAEHGCYPAAQNWAQGQWSFGAFTLAALPIVVIGHELLILAYMVIVHSEGTLTAT